MSVASSQRSSSPDTNAFRTLSSVPENAQSLAIRHLLSQSSAPCLYITHHDRQLNAIARQAEFFLPNIPIITLPAWDTLPYDRSAPAQSMIARRVAALVEILERSKSKTPFIVLTTASAFLQKLPPRSTYDNATTLIEVGSTLHHERFVGMLAGQGYRRASKVMEPGEFAVRGSIIDLYPANEATAFRLDMFDDTIDTIKSFDVLSQRSIDNHTQLRIVPTSEIVLSKERVEQFRQSYRQAFGQPHRDDALYHTVSEGQYHTGMEHWLPFFYPQMESLLAYLPDNIQICLDHGVRDTLKQRSEMILDYYQSRIDTAAISRKESQFIYNPVSPEMFYLHDTWEARLEQRGATLLEPFGISKQDGDSLNVRANKKLHTIAKAEKKTPFSVLEAEMAGDARPVILSASTQGSCDRLEQLLKSEGLKPKRIEHIDQVTPKKKGLYVSELQAASGFQSDALVLYTEQDFLGRKILQTRKRTKSSEAFMAEATAFDTGELLVHKDHGIGCFERLETLDVDGIRHDCIKLVYRDNDRLFVPVENLDLLTRHGSEAGDVELDKLGSASWQSRKAAYKEKLRLTAEALLETAAERELVKSTALHMQEDAYSDFVARFPYDETDDQERAINDVIDDLNGTKPMDRLVCGDVGFGKTEVALRAAFVAATDSMNPIQVAFIAPTTLLARQHYHNVKSRFEHSGLKVAQLSRLCSTKEAKLTREGLADGSINVVVGTHSLLADSVSFNRLGLLIIDEEQRFGVKQKEKLKSLKSDIHVLSMSATPIPRTLQMALTGVRDLSLITTPPVDRLAIRSFVTPFDPVVIKEAIKRELHRGGQVFYVTPRIADIAELKARITELAPEARLAVAHGQMSGSELDSLMNDVYEGKFDVLLSTAIIESGIDIPTANTMIINRADRFGLAQLYQLRGRVGRGKVRAYAYFTLPYHGALTPQAIKRLDVMQSLDTLGAGFTLASHDMDIRGFGNLVGEEQSGHVKDIGVELYQSMLEDAVKQARLKREDAKDLAPILEEDWSPQLNLGLSVLIPETYVSDLSLRLSLYRRAATLQSIDDIESFAAELSDRFGTIPQEAEYLFTTLKLKCTCKQAGVSRVDVGPKGAVLHFEESAISNPHALIGFISRHSDTMKLRADNSVFYKAQWRDTAHKLHDIRQLIDNVATI